MRNFITKMSFYVEFKLQLNNYYLKHEIWNSLIMTLSRKLKSYKICNSLWKSNDIIGIFLLIPRLEVMRTITH